MLQRNCGLVGENLVRRGERKRWDRELGLGGNPRRRGGGGNLYRKKKMVTWTIVGRRMGGRAWEKVSSEIKRVRRRRERERKSVGDWFGIAIKRGTKVKKERKEGEEKMGEEERERRSGGPHRNESTRYPTGSASQPDIRIR